MSDLQHYSLIQAMILTISVVGTIELKQKSDVHC